MITGDMRDLPKFGERRNTVYAPLVVAKGVARLVRTSFTASRFSENPVFELLALVADGVVQRYS